LNITLSHPQLQKIALDKTDLEKRKKELSVNLHSSDAIVIQPEFVEKLLAKFLVEYKNSPRKTKNSYYNCFIYSLLNNQKDNHK
jgi:site-specific DNA recombinase